MRRYGELGTFAAIAHRHRGKIRDVAQSSVIGWEQVAGRTGTEESRRLALNGIYRTVGALIVVVWEYDVLDHFPFATPEAKALAEEAKRSHAKP